MRRFFVHLLALTCLALALSAGLSWAQRAGRDSDRVPRLAPVGSQGSHAVRVPAAQPHRARGQHGAYTYRPVAAIVRDLGGTAAPTGTSGSGATVTITATVLPVRIIVVRYGFVSEIWSNTPDQRPGASLWIAREGSTAGAVVPVNASIWKQARSLLARSNRATGRIA